MLKVYIMRVLEESENIATFLQYSSFIAFQPYKIFHIISDTSFPSNEKHAIFFIIYTDDCIIQILMILFKRLLLI